MFKLIFIQCINIIFSCKRFLQPKIDKGYFRQFYVIRSIASKMDEKGENLHKICQNFTDLWPEKWDEEQWNWSKKVSIWSGNPACALDIVSVYIYIFAILIFFQPKLYHYYQFFTSQVLNISLVIHFVSVKLFCMRLNIVVSLRICKGIKDCQGIKDLLL